ncbi:HAD-IIA family hydrolase [Paenibacillus silvisoli]|uniref:HAD-IIA family hydrolase n=1 Tax=Paenibacillus silvisoli TaxID=3110539 RepID=UPI0028044430|nr:HAD-IIA family hydrolase [Paenibacillus silvisoli]
MNYNEGDIRFLRNMNVFMFDLDGCLYYQNRPAQGAAELLRLLQEVEKQIRFVTNNSRESASDIAVKLRSMSIPAEAEQVISAAEGTAVYLHERYGAVKVKVAGSDGFAALLRQSGHEVLSWEDSRTADCVAIGRDTDFTYDRLLKIANETRLGAALLAANPDLYHPGASGERIPETGALSAAIEAVTGREIPYVGKPSPYLFQLAVRNVPASPETSVMIGDNPWTDIAGGQRAGLRTVWLHNGQPDYPDGLKPPDLAAADAAELLAIYEKLRS